MSRDTTGEYGAWMGLVFVSYAFPAILIGHVCRRENRQIPHRKSGSNKPRRIAYNPSRLWEVSLKHLFAAASTFLLLAASWPAQETSVPPKELLLWQKVESTVHDVDRNLDGVLGVAILDLSNQHKLLLNADEVFPTASSIKIAILAEFYRQVQHGKLKLNDPYTLQS